MIDAVFQTLSANANTLREFGSFGVLVAVLWFTLRNQNNAIKALTAEIKTLTDTLRPKETCTHEPDRTQEDT